MRTSFVWCNRVFTPELGCPCTQEELKKYDGLKADIRANVDRQAELLAVLQQQQQAFRSAFGFADWRHACEVR